MTRNRSVAPWRSPVRERERIATADATSDEGSGS